MHYLVPVALVGLLAALLVVVFVTSGGGFNTVASRPSRHHAVHRRAVRRPPPPAARPKPLGPQFWTVRRGDSYWSIAQKTHRDMVQLERLNPRLKPSALRPGDRLRLR
jgi:Tfp pilus assembly protein FimV